MFAWGIEFTRLLELNNNFLITNNEIKMAKNKRVEINIIPIKVLSLI
jgi:hypothetical protein